MRKPTAIVLFAFLLGIAATCSAQSAEELKDSISAKESLHIDGVIENQKNLSLIQELEKCGNLNLKKEDYENFLNSVKLLAPQTTLLILVDKTYSVGTNFDKIKYELYNGEPRLKMTPETLKAFKAMAAAARKDGIKIWPVSTHRTYTYQKGLFDRSVKRNGIEHANKYSAKPGHSQHHLGTAVDINSVENSFAYTKEAAWLAENAGKYGFSLSFPKGAEEITGYAYEAWHFRYIGTDAVEMQDKYFGGSQQKFLEFMHKCVFKK